MNKKFSISFLLTAVIITTLLLSACGAHFEKRLYRKGFYSSWNLKTDKTQKQEGISNLQKNESEVISLDDTEENLVANDNAFFIPTKNNLESLEIKFKKYKEDKTGSDVFVQDILKSTKTTNLKAENSRTKNRKPVALYYFLSLLAIPFIFLKTSKWKKISHWAWINKKFSRIIIGLSTFTGIGSSYLLGKILQPEASNWMVAAPLSLIGLSLFFQKKNFLSLKKHHKNYLSYSLFCIGSFFFSFLLGSGYTFSPSSKFFFQEDPLILNNGTATLLVILLILMWLVSIWAIAVISCNLSCSGYSTLAAIVFLGGIPLVCFLATLGILNATKKESNRGYYFISESIVTGLIIPIGLIVIISLFSGC
jgi:hypothetical protein